MKKLYQKGHYVGPHSDQHLLYMPWENRDSLLLSREDFVIDIEKNIEKLKKYGIPKGELFIPPYEWYNDKIVEWSTQIGLKVYNYTPGLRTPADYTYPEMGNKYWSSQRLMDQLYDFENQNGLNGFIILVHLGTDSRRDDKLYYRLEEIIQKMQLKNYKFVPLKKL